MQHFDAQTLEPTSEASMAALESLSSDMNLVMLSAPEIRGLEIEAATIEPIDARSIGRLIAHESFETHHQLSSEPLYIRPPDAKLPQNKLGQKT